MSKKKSSPRRASAQRQECWHAAPLKGSFMVLSILGFLTTVYLIYPANYNFGLAFMFVFALMFIASLISTAKGPVVD